MSRPALMRLRDDLDFLDTYNFTAAAHVPTGRPTLAVPELKEMLTKIAIVDSVLNAQQSILTLR
jgi:hypothetical protein